MLRMSPRRHHGTEPKHFLLYFPEDKTCSVLPRSKLVDAEEIENLKPRSEVKAKWSDRGQKMSLFKGVIVNSDEKITYAQLKDEWTEFGKHIRACNSDNPVETFLKLKMQSQLSSGDETELGSTSQDEPKSKKSKKRIDINKAMKIKEKKHKFDSDTDDESKETRDEDAKKLLKKWKTKGAKKNAKKRPIDDRDSCTDDELVTIDDSGDEKAAQAVKKEKKAKRSLIKDYNREEDNFNREASSRVLEVLEKREPTEERSVLKDHAAFKEMLRGVLAEELKPIKESIGTLTNLYSQLNNHLQYRREKSKTSRQFNTSDKKESSTSQNDPVIVEAVKKTPPQRLFDHDELLSQPSTSGIEVKQEKEVPNEKRVTLAAAIENEDGLEYVGEHSLGVKAHKDLINKALDSSTDRKKLALNMMEVIFSSNELRQSTISGSNTKQKLDGIKVAAIKGFIFKHYPAIDEADRSSSWGRIKEAITDKCRKFRPEKRTYFDDFKY